MMFEGKSNSILISGESRGDKIEIIKRLMHYLAYLGGRKGIEGRTYRATSSGIKMDVIIHVICL